MSTGNAQVDLELRKEQYEQLQEELKEFQLSEKALTEQLDIVKTQLANESKEYQTVLEKLTQLNKDKKTLQGDFSTKNKELNKVQKELEKTKSKETGACSKVDSLTDELEEMKNCLADLEVKLKEENEEHAKLLQEEKAKVKNLKKDLTAKNKVSNNLEGKSNSLQNQLEKLKAELEERKSENTTLTSEVKSLKENLANKDKQIVELNDNVKESDEKIKRLETEKEGINAHCDSELRRMGDLMDRFKANKDKFIIQQRETIEKLNNQLDIMKCQEQTTNLLKSENENYESEVKVLKEEKDQWKKDQEESKEKQELLENEIKEKDEKIESLSAANMCSNNQIKKLEEEIEELKIKVKTVTDNTSATPSVPVESSSPKDKDSNDLETLLTTNTPAFSKPVPCTPSIRRAPPFTDVLVKRTPRQKIEATNRTPQTNNRGILRMANTMSATKKRRVIFASDLDSETSQSSSDVMEIELNDLEMRLKNKSGRSTPLIVKPSPKVQTASLFSSPASSQKSKIPLKPVRRTPNINAKKAKTEEESELEKFRMLFPEKSKEFSEKKTSPGAQRTNVRKTPCRVGGKFFKNSTTEKKKTTKSRLKSDSNDLAWFENDAVFGFGPED